MMSIRYARDGLKIVRVEVARPPVERPPALPLLPVETRELAATVRSLAARLRLDAWRSRQTLRMPPKGVPRRGPEPASDVPGEEVVRARGLARLSQRELAAELGLTRATIAEAERGVRYVPRSLGDWARTVLRDKEAAR